MYIYADIYNTSHINDHSQSLLGNAWFLPVFSSIIHLLLIFGEMYSRMVQVKFVEEPY